MAVKVIETKAVISAKDSTGSTFADVAAKLRKMQESAENAQRGMDRAMQASGKAAQASATAHAAAATAIGVGAAMAAERGLEKITEIARKVKETYREFDDLVRFSRAILDITPAQQKSLIDQAIHLGGTTKFNDLQVLAAQKELASRGIKLDQVKPIIESAADFGQAMGVDLPTSAKTLKSALFSTGQNMEEAAEAIKNAKHTTDLMVKTAKIGGLDAEGMQMLYKYGGAAAHAAGLSLETIGALGAMMSRGGIRGDEAGVAIRSFAGSLVSPNAKAMIALNAMGIDFSKYANMSKTMSPENLELATKRELGLRFNGAQKEKIRGIMQNPETRDNQADFVSAIGDLFPDMSATDAKQLANITKRFWKSSTQAVDTEGLLREIIRRKPTASQANDLFTKQQGGRFEIVAQQGIGKYQEFYDTLKHTPEGFAHGIGEQRMAGFAGAETRLEGAIMNFYTALGRANEGWMTPVTNAAAKLVQGMVEGGDKTMQLVTAFGGAVTAIAMFEAALKTGAIVQNMAGNPGGATALAGFGGGVAGRMSALGLLGLSGLSAYAIANRDSLFSAATGVSQNTLDNWKAEFEPWNRNRFTLPWESKTGAQRKDI